MTDTINTNQTRVYALTGENGDILDSYTSAPKSAFAWVLDPATGATKSAPIANTLATPWKLTDKWHAEVNFRAYCKGYYIDTEALETGLNTALEIALTNIDRLDRAEKPAKKLFTAAQVNAIIKRLADYQSRNEPVAQSLIEPFLTRLAELRNLLDGGFAQSTKQTYTDFYALPATITKINTVFSNAGDACFQGALQVKEDPLRADFFAPSADFYANGSLATVKATVAAKLATLFTADAITGIKSLDAPALISWLNVQVAALTTEVFTSINSTTEFAAMLAAPLTPIALGAPIGLNIATVTAVAVAAKKAEVEALGVKVDNHYATFASNTSTVLEQMITDLLEQMDLKAILPEIVSRVVDNRFFVTTWITAWGEESSPSAPSDALEMDQNDVGVLTRPTPPANAAALGIVGWRAYRSNVGTAGTDFQLVPDLYLVTNSAPQGSYEDVIRATYTEAYPTGWYRPTADDIAIWKQIATTGTAGTPWTNTKLRTEMLLASANSVADTVLPNVKAAAIALTNSTASLLLSDGAFNCFKLATTSYNDAAKTAQLRDVLATTTWLQPPAGLRGLTGMANGVMAGFVDNAVCFSEAYTPYAWPVAYQVTVDYPVVALAAFGQTLFVGTQGSVYLMSGSDPSSMSSQVMPGGQSCSSARSVVAVDNGALFVSPEGICLADLSGVKVLTTGLFTRSGPGGWAAMNPSTMIAAMHDGVYYLLYERTSGTLGTTIAAVVAQTYDAIAQVPIPADTAYWVDGATAGGWSLSQLRQAMLVAAAAYITTPGYEENARLASQLLLENSQMGCYALDMVSGKLTQVDVFGTAFHRDVATDKLYVAHGTKIRDLFSAATARQSVYRTGIIQTPKQSPFAWLQVDGDFVGPVVIKWYGDGVLRYSKTLTALEPVRLPAGRYREHEVEVISSGRLTSVTLAGTTEELQNV